MVVGLTDVQPFIIKPDSCFKTDGKQAVRKTDVIAVRITDLCVRKKRKSGITEEQNYLDKRVHANSSQALCSIAGGIIGATAP